MFSSVNFLAKKLEFLQDFRWIHFSILAKGRWFKNLLAEYYLMFSGWEMNWDIYIYYFYFSVLETNADLRGLGPRDWIWEVEASLKYTRRKLFSFIERGCFNLFSVNSLEDQRRPCSWRLLLKKMSWETLVRMKGNAREIVGVSIAL